ncbi:MAG: hypothetical protein JSV30_04755 [Candidatus Omnitrophota bacterium]|nr:MAG: hypothetical protein JSV30_04755 [Candidatus Omnitrophota bacterium]
MKNNIRNQITKDILSDLYCYRKMSFGDIAKQYNCSRAYILKLCKLYSIPIRNKSEARYLALKQDKLPFCYHKLNEQFFKTWTKEMAYVLGLLYADGNMHKNKSSFSLSLKEKDFLERIRNSLESTHPIKKSKVQELYHLTIGSGKMIEDLLKLGFIPRKSLKIKFPDMPIAYISHFIRGYFDGDGSIIKKNDSNVYKASIVTGSEKFISSIKMHLERLVGVSVQRINKHKTANAYFIHYHRRSDIEKLYKYFYDEYTISNKLYLSRKLLKFQEAISNYKKWGLNQLRSSRHNAKYSAKVKLEKNQTNATIEKLIAYWCSYRQLGSNISDLARYVKVSRDTAYRWLNRKAQPKEQKLQLIQEWLRQRPNHQQTLIYK